jgi:hypothetical protein
VGSEEIGTGQFFALAKNGPVPISYIKEFSMIQFSNRRIRSIGFENWKLVLI